MLKNLTPEQADYIFVLENDKELEEVFNKLIKDKKTKELITKITDEEKDFISAIINSCQLREEITRLNYITILDYIKTNGFLNLLSFIKRLEQVLIHNLGENDISRIETIFKYIDFLLHKDPILEVTKGEELSSNAKDALIAMKRDVYEEELRSLLEKIKQAEKDNSDLTSINETLSRENAELSSSNKALTQSIEHLKITRNSLLDENASLKQQIEDNRVILESGLDTEIEAERQRRLGEVATEMQGFRAAKEQEILELRIIVQNLQKELAEIDSQFGLYCGDYPIGFTQQKQEEEYDIVWEPIDDSSDLLDISLKAIEKYYKYVKNKYQEKTGISNEELDYEFASKNPGLSGFISFVLDHHQTLNFFGYYDATIRNMRTIRIEELKDVEKRRKRSAKFFSTTVNELYDFFEQFEKQLISVKIPRFIKKEKTPSYRDDIESLRLVIEAKKQIASAVAKQKIAEEALRFALDVFQAYLPEDVHTDFLTSLKDGLDPNGKKLLKEMEKK